MDESSVVLRERGSERVPLLLSPALCQALILLALLFGSAKQLLLMVACHPLRTLPRLSLRANAALLGNLRLLDRALRVQRGIPGG